MIQNCCSAQSLALATFHGGFYFNDTILSLAADIRRQLQGRYYAVHLRLEDDAAGWNNALGGQDGAVQAYIETMSIATCTNSTTLYVASGLLFGGPTPEFDKVVDSFTAAGVAKRLVYKENFVKAETLKSLHSEQLALLDLLVMSTSQVFVGHPYSTLSVLVQQMRVCAGKDSSTNHMVEMPNTVSNDNMMAQYVRFADGYKPLT